MPNILLIGSGQLGSRHLQSILKSPHPLTVDVVEPSSEAQALSKERIAQIKPGHPDTRVAFHSGISEVADKADIAIVATGAVNRAALTADIVRKNGVRLLILEKVLFQSPVEYAAAHALFSDLGVKAWVNCPRRMYPGWIKLKGLLANQGPLSLSVSGGDWGLACNAVPFIDIAAFLGCDTDFKYSVDMLDHAWTPSKRAGYKEITGLLSAISRRGDRLILFSGAGQKAPPIITIEAPETRVVVHESRGRMTTYSKETNWIPNEEDFEIKYQSDLTGSVIGSLLAEETCELTPFEESSRMHTGLIEALLTHFEPFANPLTGVLPIT